MESIIDRGADRCYVCGRSGQLETHHCLHGFRRAKADADGLTVRVCRGCHTKIHDKADLTDDALKVIAQMHWEAHYGDREAFRTRYGKSYI